MRAAPPATRRADRTPDPAFAARFTLSLQILRSSDCDLLDLRSLGIGCIQAIEHAVDDVADMFRRPAEHHSRAAHAVMAHLRLRRSHGTEHGDQTDTDGRRARRYRGAPTRR